MELMSVTTEEVMSLSSMVLSGFSLIFKEISEFHAFCVVRRCFRMRAGSLSS